MKVRKHMFAVLCFVWILTPGPSVRGQILTSQENVAKPQHHTLPASSDSEPAAKAILGRAYHALDTSSLWVGLHRAQTELAISEPSGAPAHRLLMLDDWSTEKTIYRRGFSGAKRVPRDHDGADSFVVKHGATEERVQEFDQARVLVDHLPAAALEVIQRRSIYLYKVAPSGACSQDLWCVDIYRKQAGDKPALLEQRWAIASESQLPKSVWIALPNVNHTQNEIWERVDFQDFKLLGTSLAPSSVTIDVGTGRKQVFTLLSIKEATNVDKQAFDHEVMR